MTAGVRPSLCLMLLFVAESSLVSMIQIGICLCIQLGLAVVWLIDCTVSCDAMYSQLSIAVQFTKAAWLLTMLHIFAQVEPTNGVHNHQHHNATDSSRKLGLGSICLLLCFELLSGMQSCFRNCSAQHGLLPTPCCTLSAAACDTRIDVCEGCRCSLSQASREICFWLCLCAIFVMSGLKCSVLPSLVNLFSHCWLRFSYTSIRVCGTMPEVHQAVFQQVCIERLVCIYRTVVISS